MEVTLTRKAEKLIALCQSEGFDRIEQLQELAARDTVVPGICMSRRCNFITQVRSDRRAVLCAVCDDNTVCSVLVLADLI